MTAIQAARVAATLRRELHIDVELTDGHYGELTVLVDGAEVASAGPLGFLGVLPTLRLVLERVTERMEGSRSGAAARTDA